MTWFTQIPAPAQYMIIIFSGIGLLSLIFLVFYTLKRKGKIKVGPIEMDTEEEKQEVQK